MKCGGGSAESQGEPSASRIARAARRHERVRMTENCVTVLQYGGRGNLDNEAIHA